MYQVLVIGLSNIPLYMVQEEQIIYWNNGNLQTRETVNYVSLASLIKPNI